MVQMPKALQQKLDEGRQYRNIELLSIEQRTEEEDTKVVEGYATVYNQPYELWREEGYVIMEQVDARAFDNADMSDVIMQYNHEGRVFARISNDTLRLTSDAKGLHVRADLGGTELGRQLYDEIKGGYTDKMSFGFRVEEDKREITENYEDGTTLVLRTILAISKVYDVSAVSIPANDATSISARTFGEGVIAEVKQELFAAEQRKRQKQKIKILTEVL